MSPMTIFALGMLAGVGVVFLGFWAGEKLLNRDDRPRRDVPIGDDGNWLHFGP